MDDENKRTIIVVGAGSSCPRMRAAIKLLQESEYHVEVMERMPEADVSNDVVFSRPEKIHVNVGTIGHIDYGRNLLYDVLTEHNAKKYKHFGGRGKGDRIRNRQQFRQQCAYKGRR